MDALFARVVFEWATALLGPMSMQLGGAAAGAVAGPREQRALQKACQVALRKAIDDVRDGYVTESDVEHVLGLISRVMASRGIRPVPLLLPAGLDVDATVARWRAAAIGLGLEPGSFPIGFDQVIARMLRLLPGEVAVAAAKSGSPLFATAVLHNLDQLIYRIDKVWEVVGDNPARHIPIAGHLGSRLDTARDACALRGRAFLTPDLLLVLLEPDRGPARASFEELRPGSSGTMARLLRRFIQERDLPPYQPFAWTDRDDVRNAQQVALANRAPAVADAHLFVGALDHESSTMKQVAKWFGADRARLKEIAERHVAPPDATPPGIFSD